MRRLSLILAITLLLVLLTAAAAHADYWPPESIQHLIRI